MYTLNVSFPIDTGNTLECEWIEWLQQAQLAGAADIKTALMLGYVMVKHGFDKLDSSKNSSKKRKEPDSVLAEIEQNVRTVFEQKLLAVQACREADATKKQLEISCLNSQISYLKTQLEQAPAQAQQQVILQHEHTKVQLVLAEEQAKQLRQATEQAKQQMSQQMSQLQGQLHQKDAEIRQLHDKVEHTLSCAATQELKQQIKQLDMTIAQLKGTNAVKGIIGESFVRDILSNSFPDHQVIHTASTAAESDLHLIDPHQNITVIECKYKATIVIDDVEKSTRDIHNLRAKYGSRFKAYAFFSLRTPNIPKKGHMFEMVSGVPTMWFGLNKDTDSHVSQRITEMTKVLNMVGNVNMVSSKDNSTNMEDLATFLSRQLDRIQQNIKMVQHQYDMIQSLQTTTKQLQELHNDLFTDLTKYMEDKGIPMMSQQKHNQQQQQHKCGNCNKVFKRKGDFTKHQATCSG